VPVFGRAFASLSAILKKGEAHAAAAGGDPARLVEARLAPDMLTLAGQVQRASDTAKGAAARLSGRDNPSFPDEEKSFADLEERIAKTVAFLDGFGPDDFAGAEARTVTLSFRSGSVEFDGKRYLLGFVLPNFFFHVTTAYDILRHEGVEIGKRDFLGPH